MQDAHYVGHHANLCNGKWKSVKDFLDKSFESRDLPGVKRNRREKVVYHGNNEGKLYVNFLSGTGGIVEPWWTVSGHSSQCTDSPWLNTGRSSVIFSSDGPDFPRDIGWMWYKGINYLFGEYLNAKSTQDINVYTGIVYSDFPGRDLINVIIQQNILFEPASTIRFKIDCHHDYAGNEYTYSQIISRFKNKYNQLLSATVYDSRNPSGLDLLCSAYPVTRGHGFFYTRKKVYLVS